MKIDGNVTLDDMNEVRKFGPVREPNFAGEVVRELCCRSGLGRFVVAGEGFAGFSFIVDVYQFGSDYPYDKLRFYFISYVKIRVGGCRNPFVNSVLEYRVFDLNDPASFDGIVAWVCELLEDNKWRLRSVFY